VEGELVFARARCSYEGAAQPRAALRVSLVSRSVREAFAASAIAGQPLGKRQLNVRRLVEDECESSTNGNGTSCPPAADSSYLAPNTVGLAQARKRRRRHRCEGSCRERLGQWRCRPVYVCAAELVRSEGQLASGYEHFAALQQRGCVPDTAFSWSYVSALWSASELATPLVLPSVP
jgi:hypothetical protein